MRNATSQYLTAVRYSVMEQVRNRLAFGLLIIFVPLWYYMMGTLVPGDPLPFRFRATGAFLMANGRDLALLTAGFNAITLIVGFMLFSAVRSAGLFDRRLVLCGYRQPMLIAAKVTTLALAAGAIAAYAATMLLATWRPVSFPLVWLGFFTATLIYGGLGLMLGVLMRSELAGFFIIIMLSLMDTFLQNPYGNPVANKSYLQAFPAYGPMQIAVGGGFTHVFPVQALLISLAWFAGLTLIGLIVFWLRTRAWNTHGRTTAAVQSQSGT